MLAEILRFRSGGQGRRRARLAALAPVVVVAAALTGEAVIDDVPGGKGPERTAVRALVPPRPAETVPPAAVPAAEPAPPAPEVVVSVPDPVPEPEPVAPPPAPTPAVEPAVARGARVPPPAAAAPDPIPWIAVSGPLGASPPVRVDIPAVGAAAPVGPLGLNPDGTLEVPVDFSRAGWYTGRPTPGESGPAIIVAHRAGRRGPAAFWTLPDVQPGDEVVVTRADGSRVRFVVDRLEQHQKAAFPTEAVYGPTGDTVLRLITCGGPFDPSLGDRYRDNIIVFAHMTGWVPG